jgi:signal transduction histidine kinase
MNILIVALLIIVIILLGIVLYNQNKTKSLIKREGERIMSALSQAELDLVAKFNDATNVIAAKIQTLIDNAGSPDQIAELQTNFQPVLDALTALGQPTVAKPAGV